MKYASKKYKNKISSVLDAYLFNVIVCKGQRKKWDNQSKFNKETQRA